MKKKTNIAEKLKFFSLIRYLSGIIFGILSLVIGLGIIKVEALQVKIPEVYHPHIIPILLLFAAFIAIIYLCIQNFILLRGKVYFENLVEEISQNESNASSINPFLPIIIDDVPLNSLYEHIEFRKKNYKPNPVALDLYKISCRVIGAERIKDADVTYHLKGRNILNTNLTGLYILIAGDTLTTLKDLNAKYFDLTIDTKREKPLYPKLKGHDGKAKYLFLPFKNPGIEPYKHFEIELTYKWPSLFHTVRDYWFLDNLDFQDSIKKIVLQIEFVDMEAESVHVYTLDTLSQKLNFEGVLDPNPDNLSIYTLSRENPQKETYYVLVFEGK